MEGWLHDLRSATRLLVRNRSTTAVAVLALAVGIGACTAIFSVVHGVLLQALPYPRSDRMTTLSEVDAKGNRMNFSDPNFEDLHEQNRSFRAMAQYAGWMESVSGGAEPLRVGVTVVSPEFFDVVGVQPSLGRVFAPEDQGPGAAPTVVVSHGYWQGSLAGTRDLGGAGLRWGGRVHAVIGVMPPGFGFPTGSDLWAPRGLYPRYPSRTAHNWQVVARLQDGVTLEQARRDLSAIARRLKKQLGDDTGMADAAVVPLREALTGRARPALVVLLGAVAFLLLVACANVTNLLLAQAVSRQRELAVRMALGAGRRRLVRQLVTEALLLSLLAATLGVLFASWGVGALLAFEPGKLPRVDEITVNGPVLLFALVVSLVTALALGFLTALRATRPAAMAALRDGERAVTGNASRRLLDALVLSQVAATVALLIGGGLLGRSLLRLLSADPGFRVQSVMAMDVSLPSAEGAGELARRARFHDEVIARLRALPGVREVGATTAVPLGGGGSNGSFLVVDHEIKSLDEFESLMRNPALVGEAEFRIASEGYFRALGIRLVRGRLFGESDSAETPHVAVISESLARRRWPNEDPIGRHVEFGNMDGDLRLFTIVGIVGDLHEAGLDAEPRPTFYGYCRQRPGATSSFTFVVYADGNPVALASSARRIVRALDPEVPPRFRTIEEIRATSLADRRFTLWLLGAFGLAALLLATMGIYSVTLYSVARRTREVGIRMALGAEPREVRRLILIEGARPVVAGGVLGVLAAMALSRLMASLLFGVSPGDPGTIVGVALLLGLVALAACLIPARRATRVDPLVALRSE
jgi:putative ABC transport system permease protein